ncbi:MAG: polymer-forming cytoskeletal protein [Woeseiaceae bacterium]|nr:polymer-forming cytoskeletal protein [Woeseiaceae bacterium]
MSNPYDNDKGSVSSVLGPTLKFKGELIADEDLLIKGRVEGSIRHSSSLTVGDGGHIKANVAAEYIVVEGRVQGDLNGSKCVKIRETAKIDGNIVSPSVSLVEGATFNGKIDMDGDPTAKSSDKPADTKSAKATSEAKTADAEKPATKSKRSDKKSASAA